MQVSSQLTAALSPMSRPFRVAYPVAAVRGGAGLCRRFWREHWKKIVVAVIAGALAGFFAGAVSSREYMTPSPVVYAAGVATNRAETPAQEDSAAPGAAVQQAAAQEMTRLKAENQQLQALVDELQKELPASHGRRAKTHHRKRT
jgi:hypothetical protein